MAKAGLGQQVEEGDYNGLVRVLGHLVAVKGRQNTTDVMFEPLQQTIALLKVYEQELPDEVFKQLAVRTDVQSLVTSFLPAHILSSIVFWLKQPFLTVFCVFLLAMRHLSLLLFISLCTCLLICRSCQKSGIM